MQFVAIFLFSLAALTPYSLFALDGAPGAMTPHGPLAESDPEFTWTPIEGAVQYRINVRNAANQFVFNRWFPAVAVGCADLQSDCSVRPGLNLAPATYRWRVIAKDEANVKSDWSQWRIFFPGLEIEPGPPAAPVPEGPQGEGDSNRPEFSWRPSFDVSRYRVKVIDADNRRVLNRWGSAAALGCSDGDGPCVLESPVVFEAGEYRWKVLARNRVTRKNSDWSPWTSFSVPTPAALGSGLDERPQNLSCTLPAAPPRVSGVSAERVFAGLSIRDTVILLDSPPGMADDPRWYAVQRTGEVVAWDASDPDATLLDTFLDISDRTIADTGETGLLGMAFHPDYPEDPRVFLFYTNLIGGEYESYLSEFVTPDGGESLDPGSERRLLTLTGHETHNHKGGTVAFGPEGYLYLSLGDGGRRMESQDPFSLFGTLIRIDVDSGDPYAIPPDNPFVDGLEGAPEVYAYGFRNPWRWSFDPNDGSVWLTDVGLESWEEINLVEPGANYGWPIMEGPDCLDGVDCDVTGLTLPLHAYPHDETGGIVVVGGFVYRGLAMPDLQGRFIFADGTDRVWALLFDQFGDPDPELLIDGGLSGSIIHSLFEDETGELYLVKAGLIYRLVQDSQAPGAGFPQRLSETGCVDPDEPTVMAEGLIPYGVNTPFWTDGADKSRWLALPDNGQIELDAAGDFQFPAGSVMVKEFRLFDRRIETRLFARHDDGDWAGYTYAWNEAQTEAELVEANGRQIEIEGQAYTLPSRNQCLTCHSDAAGRTLGLEVLQLNGSFHYESTGRSANQLTTLEAIGALRHALPADPEALPALVSLDDHAASFSDRARSYLHANCASCHRPSGPGRGPADMRFQPLQHMNVCDVLPEVSDLGVADARLIAPGAPERSIIALRLAALDYTAMPPIGKNLVDVEAAAVVEEFIAGLEDCPE